MNGKEIARKLDPVASSDLLSVSKPPSDPKVRQDLAALVDRDILNFVEGRLTREETALLHRDESGGSWTERQRGKILGVLDKAIIERAQTVGWRIYLSRIVLLRMAQWHGTGECVPADNGSGLNYIKELGQAVTLAARVARGEAKLPISEREWKPTKAQTVEELRRLIKQLRRAFNPRRTATSFEEACEWIRGTVEGSPKAFPSLSRNLQSLLRYFKHAKLNDDGFAARLAQGDFTPGKFFDEWVAWGNTLSPETVRQEISNLHAAKL